MTRRKDRYQPRAASASQPKTLKTYTCARDCSPRRRRRAPCGRDRDLIRGASAIGRDRWTIEERLSDIVEILAHGLLWLDVLRDYHGSIRSHSGLIRPPCIGLPPPTSTASNIFSQPPRP
jgi:hypothetical protein